MTMYASCNDQSSVRTSLTLRSVALKCMEQIIGYPGSYRVRQRPSKRDSLCVGMKQSIAADDCGDTHLTTLSVLCVGSVERQSYCYCNTIDFEC